MTNDNNKDLTIVEKFKEQLKAPQTETRIVVETQDLYPDLVHEDIGSNKGYGPCLEYSCRCNKRQLREQIRTLENKIPYAPDSATFYLKVYFSQNRLSN